MKKRLTLILLMALSAITAFTQTEKRLALVIGNAEYVGKGNTLRNPVNDANDVSTKLKALGFDVTTLRNGSKLEMKDAIHQFSVKAKNSDVALFYYSGHGLQSEGQNYMMPVDAEPDSPADIEYSCYPLNQLLDKLDESNCPMKIVVLDACRNNPFTRGWYRSSAEDGLASVNPPRGTFITFATAAGSKALDGTGRNSPYTNAFLETLDVPNLTLFDFFNTVGQQVLEETNNRQDPWTNHSTMKGDFCFNVTEKETTPATPIEFDRMAKELEELSNKAQSNYNKAKQYLDNDEIEKAIPYLLEAANSGHTEAQSKLGFYYFKGYGVEQDYEASIKWWKKAANSGDDVAQRNLGFMYEHGFGLDKPDINRALDWYWKSAMNGNKSASEDFARLLNQNK